MEGKLDQDKPRFFIPNKFKEHFLSRNETSKYLFSNSRNDFAIYPVEVWLKQLKLPVYPHRKTVTSILFLRSGTAEKSCGIDSYKLQKDQLIIVPQGYLTGTPSISPDSTGFYCRFDFSIFPLISAKKLKKAYPFLFTDEFPHFQLDEASSDALTFLFYRLINEYFDNGKNLNFNLISSYLIAAFEEIKLFFPDERSEKLNRYTKITGDFKELLYNQVKETKSVTDFANKLNVSPNHLNKCVKAVSGKTAKELINEALVMEAKNLLFETDLSVGEISRELGIEDQAYFSRLFKQLSGNSPQQFRKMIEKSK